MKKILYLLLAISLFHNFVNCQQPILEWATRYTAQTGYAAVIKDALTDSAGNTYVTGYLWIVNQPNTSDGITLKISPLGSILWVKIFNSLVNTEDAFNALAIDKLGNCYVTGYSFQYGFLTIKYNSNGDTVWQRSSLSVVGPNIGRDIAIDDTGNVYITGNIYLPGPNSDYATIKFDSSGAQLWIRTFGGTSNLFDAADRIAVDNEGNIIVSGDITRINSVEDVVTIKYNTEGNQLWQKMYSGVNNEGASGVFNLIIDDSDNIFFYTAPISYKRKIIKYNTFGDSILILTPSDSILSISFCVDDFKNIYLTSIVPEAPIHSDCVIIKYSPLGSRLWQKKYAGSLFLSRDGGENIIKDTYGNLYVAGYMDSNWIFNDFLTLKYDNRGNLLWKARYDFAQFSDDKAFYVNLDSMNNVYVTGITGGGGLEYGGTITVIKYSQPPLGIVNIGGETPAEYELFQNYPNPFNPNTKIRFKIPDAGYVSLIIYDLLGREVKTIVNNKLNAGVYEISFDASGFSSGTYIYRLIIDGKSIDTKKMSFVK